MQQPPLRHAPSPRPVATPSFPTHARLTCGGRGGEKPVGGGAGPAKAVSLQAAQARAGFVTSGRAVRLGTRQRLAAVLSERDARPGLGRRLPGCLRAPSAGPAAGAEALGRRDSARLGSARLRAGKGRRWERRSLYGGGSVGPGCPALALGRRALLWGLLQGADPHAAHLLRPGLETAHQLPVPVHRGLHDAQCAPAGSY